MLKIIALIACDNCNGVLPKIAAAAKIDSELNEELHELMLSAEADGWQLRRNSTEHYCVTCQFS
ncbi:MAG: hypothetical protein HC888_07695 [Candidatus Competibacteraceae bacterium]|jgi:ribosomal protein S26|nr:hypothetical protein [Candidatus Competibacteraceae bacterium]